MWGGGGGQERWRGDLQVGEGGEEGPDSHRSTEREKGERAGGRRGDGG